MDETNSVMDQKLNIVFEETEKTFGISFIESKRQYTKAGLMIWTELLALNKVQNAMPTLGKEDNNIWTAVWENSHLDISNVKHKNT